MMEKISISALHDHLGGKATPSNDFMVSLDYKWPDTVLDGPYRAEGSAIIFCINGSASISVNMREMALSEGSVMIYGRESIVEFSRLSDDLRVYLIFFSNSFMQETLLDLKSVLPIFKYVSENMGELVSLDTKERAVIKKIYELIYDVMDFNKPSIVRDLVTSFMRMLGEIYNRRVSDSQAIKTRQEEYLEHFLKEVAQHHKKHRSVKFYADALHITPKYLSTVIKEISGKSAASWINDFVIQESKVLLRFSGKSIQEITYELNFSTQSFFGKYFKRHTGLSPSEYRLTE